METIDSKTKSKDKSMVAIYSNTVRYCDRRDQLHNKKWVVQLIVEISGVVMVMVSCWIVLRERDKLVVRTKETSDSRWH